MSKVYFVDSSIEADENVYVVDYPFEADEQVFVVDHPLLADKKVHRVDHHLAADTKIFIVDYVFDATPVENDQSSERIGKAEAAEYYPTTSTPYDYDASDWPAPEPSRLDRLTQNRFINFLISASFSALLFLLIRNWIDGLWEIIIPGLFFVLLLSRNYLVGGYMLISVLAYGLSITILDFSTFWGVVASLTWPLSWPFFLYHLTVGYIGIDWAMTLSVTLFLLVVALIGNDGDIGDSILPGIYIVGAGIFYGLFRADGEGFWYSIGLALIWPLVILFAIWYRLFG